MAQAGVLLLPLVASVAGCAALGDVTGEPPEPETRPVASYEEVVDDMDQAMGAIASVLEQTVGGGEVVTTRGSMLRPCGAYGEQAKMYFAANMEFTAPDITSALPELDEKFPAALAEHGFSTGSQISGEGNGRLLTFTNDQGDEITIGIHPDRAMFGGKTPCFRPAGQEPGS